jgi:hypothetical protein
MPDKRDEPESGLSVYDGSAEDYIDKIAKNKALKNAVKKDAATDGDNLEKRRQRVGAVERIALDNINKFCKLATEKSAPSTTDKRQKEIAKEMEHLFMQNNLMVPFGTFATLTIIADSLTIRDEEEAEIDGKKGRRQTRTSLADMISRCFDDDEFAYDFMEKDDLNIPMEMMHCFGKALGALHDRIEALRVAIAPASGLQRNALNVFEGDVIDEQGVPARVPDKIEWLKKRVAEAEAKAVAEMQAQEQAARAANGVSEEEAARINSANSFDDLFGGPSNGGK